MHCTVLALILVSETLTFIRLDWHSEKSQMVTLLQYRCDIATWVPRRSTNVTQRTFHVQCLIQHILCENELKCPTVH